MNSSAFISSLLAKGVDLLTVQIMAGHSDPPKTSEYDLRPEENMSTAATMLHLPYYLYIGALDILLLQTSELRT
jgi:site-specific recombinase XerD